MEIAICRVVLNEYTDITMAGITPAEALTLEALHGANSGGKAVKDAVQTASVERSDTEELQRLRETYKSPVIEKLFPGVGARVPHTFEQIGLKVQRLDGEADLPPPLVPEPKRKRAQPE